MSDPWMEVWVFLSLLLVAGGVGGWLSQRCPEGGCHRWETFQMVRRVRCQKCGMIEDEDGERFASFEDYVKRGER